MRVLLEAMLFLREELAATRDKIQQVGVKVDGLSHDLRHMAQDLCAGRKIL